MEIRSMRDVNLAAEEELNAVHKFSYKYGGYAPHWEFTFPNGYGASVINDGYGREMGLFELAVVDSNNNLCYDTEITDDVIGWLDPKEVYDILVRIANLPKRG